MEVDDYWLIIVPPVARGSLDNGTPVPRVDDTCPAGDETPVTLTSASEPIVEASPISPTPAAETTPVLHISLVRELVCSPVPKLGKELRQNISSVQLSDYVTYNTISTLDTHHTLIDHSVQTSSSVQDTSFYPLQDYISDAQFSPSHRVYLAAITKEVEPKHFKEEVRVKVWKYTMTKEVMALEENKTWDLVTLPSNKVAIGSQWVFKIKYNADGSIE